MFRAFKFFLLLFLVAGCIEPYEFRINNETPSLVVEGFISNVSYNETLQYPSEGRYFTVKLRLTSDVTNLKDDLVKDASVALISSSEEEWQYTESSSEPGTYVLYDKNFKACQGQEYKLRIVLAGGKNYESDWEQIPEDPDFRMGSIGFEETEKNVYVIKGEREVAGTVKGLNVTINIPENTTGKTEYFRWDFHPVWIFIAHKTRPSNPNHKCWATNEHYLSGYTLKADRSGGYSEDLFFIETKDNERIFERLSVLIKQYKLTEGYYNFWREMQEQTESGGLSDIPPYNLQSNFQAVDDGTVKVSGYFGVVSERATRWYFSKKELSYFVEDRLEYNCEVYIDPISGYPPSCLSCLDYFNGPSTNIGPVWWEE